MKYERDEDCLSQIIIEIYINNGSEGWILVVTLNLQSVNGIELASARLPTFSEAVPFHSVNYTYAS